MLTKTKGGVGMFRYDVVKQFLFGNVHLIKKGYLTKAELSFLNEFFYVDIDEFFNEKTNEVEGFFILTRKEKFLFRELTNGKSVV